MQANLKAAEARAGFGEVFNISSGAAASVNDLWAVIQKSCGTAIAPHYQLERPGDIKHSHADIGKAKLVLGFSPVYDLAKGIGETVAWYRDAYEPA